MQEQLWDPESVESFHVKINASRGATSAPSIPAPEPDATTNALSGTATATSIIM